jgi:two-component system sensor histidine kinase UhpB
MSLKLKLNLLITGLLALVFVLGALLTLYGASGDIRRETQSSVQLASHLIETQLDRASERDVSSLREILKPLAGVRHLDARLIDPQGAIVASNESAPASITAPDWFIWLLQVFSSAPPTFSRQVFSQGTPLGTFVIAADPSSEIEEIWNGFRTIAWLVALLFVALNALVYWLVARSLSPLDEVLAGFSELQNGNYKFRLRKFRLSELEKMGTLFNETAETLESAQSAQRSFNQKLVMVREDERRNLARELHDELGQSLAAIHAESCFIVQKAEKNAPEILESAHAIVAGASDMQKLTRSMLARLRPSALNELGLEESLRDLVSGWKARQQRRCSLAIAGDFSSLDESTQLALYRTVQESLTNISRHSDASEVEVALGWDDHPDMVRLSVTDNGSAAQDPGPGLGLLGIRERILALGGALSFGANERRGFTLVAMLPAKRAFAA